MDKDVFEDVAEFCKIEGEDSILGERLADIVFSISRAVDHLRLPGVDDVRSPAEEEFAHILVNLTSLNKHGKFKRGWISPQVVEMRKADLVMAMIELCKLYPDRYEVHS